MSDIFVEELSDSLRDNSSLYSAFFAGAISEAAYPEDLRKAGLIEVEVVERLVCEIPGLKLSTELINEIPPLIVGRIWSARFVGAKAGQ